MKSLERSVDEASRLARSGKTFLAIYQTDGGDIAGVAEREPVAS